MRRLLSISFALAIASPASAAFEQNFVETSDAPAWLMWVFIVGWVAFHIYVGNVKGRE